MAIREFIVNGESVYIDDELEENETGVASLDEEDLSKTKTINVISEEDKLSETITDVFGDRNE